MYGSRRQSRSSTNLGVRVVRVPNGVPIWVGNGRTWRQIVRVVVPKAVSVAY